MFVIEILFWLVVVFGFVSALVLLVLLIEEVFG